MKDLRQKTTYQFLADEVYLPGYMLLANEDYDKKGATFDFNVKEPPVARGDIVHYFTPRGLHICVSQAGYALVEHMVREGQVEGFELQGLRETLLAGRVKITELYQRFRREVGLSKLVQGRFDVERFRMGKLPVLKLDFSFANDAITGNLVSVIAPRPVPQMNRDIIRI
ncbi:MAG: hypothetical protein AABX17_02505 [Nanoarchaeota archaeon]